MAQLTGRSLQIPEDLGSNPVIGNIFDQFTICIKDGKRKKPAIK